VSPAARLLSFPVSTFSPSQLCGGEGGCVSVLKHMTKASSVCVCVCVCVCLSACCCECVSQYMPSRWWQVLGAWLGLSSTGVHNSGPTCSGSQLLMQCLSAAAASEPCYCTSYHAQLGPGRLHTQMHTQMHGKIVVNAWSRPNLGRLLGTVVVVSLGRVITACVLPRWRRGLGFSL
jgi:hypothetical protein